MTFQCVCVHIDHEDKKWINEEKISRKKTEKSFFWSEKIPTQI